jgi:glucan endo-1,3-alpha-glucosidase
VDNPGLYFAGVQSPYRNLHAGYLELSKRYITWFKTGQPPTTNQDALFYFYRIHPKDAVAFDTNDVAVTWRTGDVQDAIYTTTFLTAPATLEVASGGVLTTNSLPAGMNYLHTPFAPGTQMLTLRRNGQQLISVQGPSVLSAINSYNFFTASGYAYANGTSSNEAPQAPSIVQPPGNFRIINH